MWAFLLRFRARLEVQGIFSDTHFLLFWAVVAGVLGALATTLFHAGINFLQWTISGSSGSFPDMARRFSPWIRFWVPALGGVAAGLVLLVAQKLGHRSDDHLEYVETIAFGNGKIPVRQSLLRSFSSLLTIGTGGSIGRESPMVQLSALAASLVGRFARFDSDKLRLLVACGAAAGVTAAYSAPIAGSIFVCEIVLGSIAVESFGPVVISAVVSNIVMREFAGYHAPYVMPPFPVVTGWQIVLFAILGIFCGVLGPNFLKLLRFSREKFKKIPIPLPLRLGLGGLGVGVIAVWVPDVWGNGYSVVNSILHKNWAWQVLLLVLFCKVLATALTAGSGALGGTFTPTLFVGATFGSIYGILVNSILPFPVAGPYAYAMVSMGAVLAGATQAPLMAILMIFEMTMSYQVMLPLMVATIVAYFVSRLVSKNAMYEVTQHRLDEAKERAKLMNLTVVDFVEPAKTVANEITPIKDLVKQFFEYPVKYIYIADSMGKFCGVVALKDVTADLIAQKDLSQLTAQHYCQLAFPTLAPEMTLEEVWVHFMRFPGERLPVVDGKGFLLGVVYKSYVLGTYKKMMSFSHVEQM